MAARNNRKTCGSNPRRRHVGKLLIIAITSVGSNFSFVAANFYQSAVLLKNITNPIYLFVFFLLLIFLILVVIVLLLLYFLLVLFFL